MPPPSPRSGALAVVAVAFVALVQAAVLQGRGTEAGACPRTPATSPGRAARSAPLFPVRGILFGAWLNPGDGWSQAAVRDLEGRLGRKLAIDHHYHVWPSVSYSGSLFPTADEEYWDKRNGRISLVSWGGNKTQYWPPLREIVDGVDDDVFRARARSMKAFRGRIFFRPMYEMNGDWLPWDGTHNNDGQAHDGPALFVAAWRHIHAIFDSEGATNVVWVWSPNDRDYPDADWNHWTKYYPGDRYVDWVGIDGYNWGGNLWTEFCWIFGGSRSVYADYARRKPIMIAETGAVEDGGSKSDWLRRAGTAMKTRLPAVKAFVYFSSNADDRDWRVTSSAQSFAAFARMAQDPYFRVGCAQLACTGRHRAPSSLLPHP
jgi:hypothetical protein